MTIMTIRYIFHLSDIHIRNGDIQISRYDEYTKVFDNLHISLQNNIKSLNLQPQDFLIILTGDIFHNKNIIGNYGLTLYKQLITILTSLGRTIIFHGNHDKCQDVINQPSLISSTLNIQNLTILTHTQAFIIGDIGFSYVSIDDTLDTFRTSGRIENLPPFPEIQQAVKYKIALFHGTFANVKLHNGNTTTHIHNPYPFEWIKDFDYALLGDIHLRQSGKYNKTLWGYAGSLIQQNYGEDLINHGYMIWNIQSASISPINIYNEYGLAYIKESSAELLIYHKNKYIPLLPFIESNRNMFPSTLEIKLHSNVNMTNLIAILKDHKIKFNIINKSSSTLITKTNEQTIATIDNNNLLEYFNKCLSEQQYKILASIIKNTDQLLFNTSDYPQELHDECHKKNKELATLIQSTLVSDLHNTRPSFNITYLEWENLYCYENKNWINFEATNNSTFLISGNNGIGKSAIYDILTLAIWGDITPQKQSCLSKGIINSNHNKAYTTVDICLNSTLYRIHRKFNHINDKYNVNKSHTYLYEYDNTNNKFNLLKADNACNNNIINLFGTLEDFLASSMITQNMDMNILTMNYKDTLSYIDKAMHIDYIYNLYNLFKVSINKYKDFKKTIENKKQVYEHIFKSSKHLDINTYNSLQSKLILLYEQKQTVLQRFNAISINITDPANNVIMNTDYRELINMLGEIYIQSDEEFDEQQEKYNELKILLKNISDIPIYANKYNQTIQDAYDSITNINAPSKPCEYSYITSEESLLQKYKTIQVNNDMTPLTLSNKLSKLQEEYQSIYNNFQEISLNKPSSASPKISTTTILTYICELFPSLDIFLAFCNSHNRPPLSDQVLQLSDHISTPKITYDSYLSLQNELKNLTLAYNESQGKLIVIDKKITEVYNKQQNIPHTSCPTNNNTYNLPQLATILSQYNPDFLQKSIDESDKILEQYYQEFNKIETLETALNAYKQELTSFLMTKDYEYNPKCKICCKRPWVQRIKELNKLIPQMQKDIYEKYNALYDRPLDYLAIFIESEKNKESLNTYYNLKNWYDYLQYKESTDSINNHLKEKEAITQSISNVENRLVKIKESLTAFIVRSYELFDAYNDIQKYKIYSEWKQTYDNCHNKLQNLTSQITSTTEILTYLTDIKPRLDNLNALKQAYINWQKYEELQTIIQSYNFISINNKIIVYNKYKSYIHEESLKPLIVKKIELQNTLMDIDKQINIITEQIASHKAYEEYNTLNANNHRLLNSSLISIENTIDVMTIIIDKFKEFRKELYTSTILKNLTNKTNILLSLLCHKNTKPFQLDYLITETKDILHINWLIKNANEDTIISINQASGFQRFAISLAIRMTLYEQYNYQQLFIDEGFTACDKQNLSVVPSFLKNLLNHFNSIIIVSHIDIIQDSTENKAEIIYNPKTHSSRIKYGEYKNI